METVLLVLGWVLWGSVLILGVALLAQTHSDAAFRFMSRTSGVVQLGACVAVILLSIPRFWIVAAIPLSLLVPMFLMNRRMAGVQARLHALQRESQQSGVPLAELLDRETKRLAS